MKVLLIVPPFGPIEYPVLGPSLLKAELQAAGIPCAVHYACIDFAHRIGFDAYNATYYTDPPLLMGERVFARALSGDAVPPLGAYWQDVVVPFAEGMMTQLQRARLSEARFQELQAAEGEAESFVEEVARAAAVQASDIIGLNSTFAQHVPALAIAKRIKALYPEKTLILGGANCEQAMGRQTLASFPFVDYVSTGPADRSLLAFVRALEERAVPHVPGIIGRQGGSDRTLPPPREPDLDALPYPDYEDFFDAYARYPSERRRIHALPVEGARGCWWGAKHHCIFCGISGEQMAFRRKPARRLYDEIRALVDRYGVRRIWATDYILDPRYFDDLIPMLEAEHTYDELFFEVKASLRKEQLRALARAGVSRLQPGIESLDTSVLRVMKKGTTALQNLQLLKWAAELDLTLQWNIICGFPNEEAAAYGRMYELMTLIPHLPAPKACSQITIDRFSPLFTDPGGFGIEIEPARAYRYVYPLDGAARRGLAYFHSQRSDAVDSRASLSVPAYATDVFRQTKIWQGLSGRVRLEYEVRSDGAVAVHDTRPCSTGRHRVLRGDDAAVLLQIDRASTPAAVEEELGRRNGGGPGAAAIRESLDRLGAWRYVYHEAGKYLALTTRKRETRRPLAQTGDETVLAPPPPA